MGWACYTRLKDNDRKPFQEWHSFSTKEGFWSFVEKYLKAKVKLYLVAHNVGFDFRIVEGFNYTKRKGWSLSFFYNKGTTCLLSYRKGSTTIQVLDLTNFFPMSLSGLGDAMGLAKQEVDFKTVDDLTLSAYCYRDVEIMIRGWLAWQSFLDDHNLGNFKHTLPAQAFNAYRHRFMKYPIHIHNKPDICELEREAYRGGRTEVFWSGRRTGKQYYQVDVNSMYAYVMQQNEYPTKLLGTRKSASIHKLTKLLGHSLVIANVEIETQEPVFPIHTGIRNVYPIGCFETTLTTPELKYALAHSMIKKINQVAWYKGAPIFQEYSTYFGNLKEHYGQAGNKAFRTIAKLFGNSLYGKFGQRGMKSTISRNVSKLERTSQTIIEAVEIEKPPWIEKGGNSEKPQRQLKAQRIGRTYRLGDDFIFEETGGESYDSFPAIAAHVTAYARMYLWSLLKLAGPKNTFYTDTDCLIVNQEGYNNLVSLLDPHTLGMLKVEKQASSLTIHAAKDYALGNKRRIKGIRDKAKKVTTNTFLQEQFLGLPGAIQRELPNLVTIKTIRKTLCREVKTGTVEFDGWVTPFRFPLVSPLR